MRALKNDLWSAPFLLEQRSDLSPFDVSCTDQVLELLSTQIAKIGHTSLDAIILVGGFSASEYLYTRVRQAFGADVPVVVRPQDCDTATLRGAARYGLGLKMGRGGVSSVISPRSYCMKSKLPADEEDHWRRPEYITTNDGGTVVCENRLSCEFRSSRRVLRRGKVPASVFGDTPVAARCSSYRRK